MDQPRSGRHGAALWCVGRHDSSLRGGLVPLAIFLMRVRASLSLGEMGPRVLHRFSTLGLCCVSALVVSGISNSWLLVGSVYALFTTPYGRLLVVKLTSFAILVGFGARNRFLVKAK